MRYFMLSSVAIVPLPTHRQWHVALMAFFPPSLVQISLLRTSRRLRYKKVTHVVRHRMRFLRCNLHCNESTYRYPSKLACMLKLLHGS